MSGGRRGWRGMAVKTFVPAACVFALTLLVLSIGGMTR